MVMVPRTGPFMAEAWIKERRERKAGVSDGAIGVLPSGDIERDGQRDEECHESLLTKIRLKSSRGILLKSKGSTHPMEGHAFHGMPPHENRPLRRVWPPDEEVHSQATKSQGRPGARVTISSQVTHAPDVSCGNQVCRSAIRAACPEADLALSLHCRRMLLLAIHNPDSLLLASSWDTQCYTARPSFTSSREAFPHARFSAMMAWSRLIGPVL